MYAMWLQSSSIDCPRKTTQQVEWFLAQHSAAHLQQHPLHVINGCILKIQQLQRTTHRMTSLHLGGLACADGAQLQGGTNAAAARLVVLW
jgi:hypothetical protein